VSSTLEKEDALLKCKAQLKQAQKALKISKKQNKRAADTIANLVTHAINARTGAVRDEISENLNPQQEESPVVYKFPRTK
jgi:formamidopyrimidine-DNA glycosylase